MQDSCLPNSFQKTRSVTIGGDHLPKRYAPQNFNADKHTHQLKIVLIKAFFLRGLLIVTRHQFPARRTEGAQSANGCRPLEPMFSEAETFRWFSIKGEVSPEIRACVDSNRTRFEHQPTREFFTQRLEIHLCANRKRRNQRI